MRRQQVSFASTTPQKAVRVTTVTPGRVVGRRRLDGDREVVFRVVNGRDAVAGEVPYQVSLRKRVLKSKFFLNFCGGTVITPKEVLSAAHCFKSTSIFDKCCSHSGRASKDRVDGVFAVAGILKSVSQYYGKEDTKEHGQWRRVRSVRYPKTFNFPHDDIAIVFLNGSYTWTDTVKPIPYALNRMEYKGSCLLSGYGRIKDAKRSKDLLVADLRVLSAQICSRIHQMDMSKMVCTSDEVSDTGKGDSGGPLVCKNTGDLTEGNSTLGLLVGVVSGTNTLVKEGSFFTRVTSYAKFIEDTIREDAAHPELSVACVVLSILCWCL